MQPKDLKVGGRYNFVNQKDRLIYLGRGNNAWCFHEFENVEQPGVVWTYLPDKDIYMLEQTRGKEEDEKNVLVSAEDLCNLLVYVNDVAWRGAPIRKTHKALASAYNDWADRMAKIAPKAE